MTMHGQGRGNTRRLQAAIIGLGLDGPLRPIQIVQGEDCVLIGGSDKTRAELLEVMLRLESELDRMGRRLGDLAPDELAEMAWRIDSPELHEIALTLQDGLNRSGTTFGEVSPEELTRMATSGDARSQSY